ncbi:MAG: BMC domain-containing protein [Candidatus Schekmanbacteria bacterium]|nr:BMC domain-containing protein [Candidatus Schekmanbacteria bacterium]
MILTIGLIELNSVAAGILVADAMVKKAPVELVEATPICPGKYIVLISGDVASVEESIAVGLLTGAEKVVDQLLLPQVHEQVIPAIHALTEVGTLDALGIIETFTVASAIVAADAAAKAAAIDLIEVRIGKGLGGKAFVTFTGDIADVEAAMEAGCLAAASSGLLLNRIVIPAPHPDLVGKIL